MTNDDFDTMAREFFARYAAAQWWIDREAPSLAKLLRKAYEQGQEER